MFFLFPLGHEQMEARRWPLVTLAIIALCALILGWTVSVEHGLEAETQRLRAEAVQLVTENPGTELPDGVRRLVVPMPFAARDGGELVPPPTALVELGERADALRASWPSWRFGFSRSSGGWTVVTAAFLHGGFLHFLSNAWFLWLAGATIEDRWGRGVFAGFYLLAAVVSALTHTLFTSRADIPLIGASGAVAGAMGAFMVVHGSAKIRFAYLLLVSLKPRAGTFEARAYVMLLLWLAAETFWAVLGVADGTAHFAHVGGFVFGAAAAFGFKRSGIDRRLDAQIDAQTSSWQDQRVLEASKLGAERRYDEAFGLLDRAARDLPQSIDVQLERLRLAQEVRDGERERAAYRQLIENYLLQNMHEAALSLLNEVWHKRIELGRAGRLSIAEMLARAGQRSEARQLYERLLEESSNDEIAVRSAIAFAVLARGGRELDARRYLELAQSSPHRTPELSQRIEAQLAALTRTA